MVGTELAAEPTNSTHRVEVVAVTLEPHPNADSLSVVRIFGYCVVVRTVDWQGVSLGAYVPPDSLVDVGRPEFSFLADQAKSDGKARVKAKKLRGVVSFGLLIPAPAGVTIGDDIAAQLGVEHYEPPMDVGGGGPNRSGLFISGEVASAPPVTTVKYDLDAFRRYHHLFVPDEPVFITEKIDGCNARYVYTDGRMHCGSRTEWKKEFPSYDHVTVDSLKEKVGLERAQEIVDRLQCGTKARNLWWTALANTPALEKFCRDNPGIVVYGECYGHVQKLRYGHAAGAVSFVAFDLMRDGRWVDPLEAREIGHSLPWVPLLANARPYSFELVAGLAEGQSTMPGADHIREGCVVKPLRERWNEHVGRVCFKCVGGAYLEKFR